MSEISPKLGSDPTRDESSSEKSGSINESKDRQVVEELGKDNQVAFNEKRHWYRSTFFNVTILGICSFLSPGLWGAMNSLGAGGSQSPSLVNAANSCTFCLMVLTCFFNSTLVNYTSIKFALIVGTMGYAPYAAGLYTNVKYGNEWFVVLGAALCGISAGWFWSSEGAIVLSYPERNKQGVYLSYWLMFRVGGQFLGGIINLALNANRSEQGSVGTNTYLVFIALQACAPFVAMLLSPPHKVQRKDNSPVYLNIESSLKNEVKNMLRLLSTKKVLYLLPIIWMGTFSEALTSTYAVTYFSVRSRALGSLISAIVAALANYLLGLFIDYKKLTLNKRAKVTFFGVYVVLQGTWWALSIWLMNKYHEMDPKPSFDWDTPGFGRAFFVYLMLQMGFNMMYESSYFFIGNIGDDPSQLVRMASILRGTESAGQAVSYGINSTSLRLDVVAGINAAQWFIALLPAYLVIKDIGITKDGEYIYEPAIYAAPEVREELKNQGVVGAEPTVTENRS